MLNRKQKIEELLEDFGSLKRVMVFRGFDIKKMPRITPSQCNVLMLIEQRGVCSVKDVADALGISSSAATQLVDGLVEGTHVTRSENAQDRRAVSITLSKPIKSKIKAMKRHMAQKLLAVFELLTDAEFSQYCALNKKIVQGFLQKSHTYKN